MFRKNPVMVEAVQVTPHGFKDALAFAVTHDAADPVFVDGEPAIKLDPALGEMPPIAKNGDWLVKEPSGLIIVSDADFEKEYHPVRGPKTVKSVEPPPPIEDDDESGMAGDPLAGPPPAPRSRKK